MSEPPMLELNYFTRWSLHFNAFSCSRRQSTVSHLWIRKLFSRHFNAAKLKRMESKKCPGPTNLNQNSGFWAKFDSSLWDADTFLTPCVRGLSVYKQGFFRRYAVRVHFYFGEVSSQNVAFFTVHLKTAFTYSINTAAFSDYGRYTIYKNNLSG